MKFLKQLLFRRQEEKLFGSISGYSDVKWILRRALEQQSEEPVHILLTGPPCIGKTRFLKAIEREYSNSYFALASGSTGAGMINYCFQNQPRFLLIDEIEDLGQAAQSTLLSLLQDGCLDNDYTILLSTFFP